MKVFYVSPDATNCIKSSTTECTIDSPCPFSCPFSLDEFTKYDDVTVKLNPGTYNLSKESAVLISSPRFKCRLYIIGLSRSGQSITVESIDDTQPDETLLVNFPQSEVFTNDSYTCKYLNIAVFLIFDEEISLTLRGFRVESIFPQRVTQQIEMYPKQGIVSQDSNEGSQNLKHCNFLLDKMEVKNVYYLFTETEAFNLVIQNSRFENVNSVGNFLLRDQNLSVVVTNCTFKNSTIVSPFEMIIPCEFFLEVLSNGDNDGAASKHVFHSTVITNCTFSDLDIVFFNSKVGIGYLVVEDTHFLNYSTNSGFFEFHEKGVFMFASMYKMSVLFRNCSVINLQGNFITGRFWSRYIDETRSVPTGSFNVILENMIFQGSYNMFGALTADSPHLIQIEWDIDKIWMSSEKVLPLLTLVNCDFFENVFHYGNIVDLIVKVFEDPYDYNIKLLRVSECRFSSNIVRQAAIRVYAEENNWFVDITDSHFFNTTSGVDIYGYSEVLIDNCVFEKNSNTSLTISGALLAGAMSGGYYCRFIVNDTLFRDNQGRNGGAVAIHNSVCSNLGDDANCGFYSTIFINNKGDNGGAIYGKGNYVHTYDYAHDYIDFIPFVFSIHNVIFKENDANFGGAIFLEGSMKLCLAKIVFFLNPVFIYTKNGDPSRFIANSAQSGGAIYMNGFNSFYWGMDESIKYGYNCSEPVDKALQFSGNYEISSNNERVLNNVTTAPGYLVIYESAGWLNNCSEYIGANNWKCDLNQLGIVDFYGNRIYSPSFDEHLLSFSIQDKKSGKSIPATISLKERNVTKKPIQLYFYAKFKHNNQEVPVTVQFMGKSYSLKMILKKKYRTVPEKYLFLIIGISLGVIMITCLLCSLCVIASVAISCVFGCLFICTCGKSNSNYEDEAIFFNYGEIPEFVNSISTSSPSSERESLMEIKPIQLDRNHFFYGSVNGVGTIFYHKTGLFLGKRFYPVFWGHFEGGKKNGDGVEYHFHDRNFISRLENWKFSHPDGLRPLDFVEKFSGVYTDDIRSGFGTEFKNDSSNSQILMGQWVEGVLTEIFTIKYPLEEMNIQTDLLIELPPIGKGGFSNVYKAKYKGKDVAVKIFGENSDIHSTDSSSFKPRSRTLTVNLVGVEKLLRRQENFKSSSRIGGILKRIKMNNHPNIVSVIAWTGPKFVQSDFGYVMDLCKTSVREYCSTHSVSLRVKDKILIECARGMECFHERCGFIHRDLKLDNILLTSTDESTFSAKICDFNLGVRDFDKKGVIQSVAGSPFNCAPEVFLEKKITRKSDVYSFGIMMYELYFDKIGDPFDILQTGRCPSCGVKMTKSLALELKEHHIQHFGEGTGNEKYSGIFPKVFETKDVNDDDDEEEENEGELEEEEEEERVVVGGKFREGDWRIRLMMACLRKVPVERPSFAEIVEIYVHESFRDD